MAIFSKKWAKDGRLCGSLGLCIIDRINERGDPQSIG